MQTKSKVLASFAAALVGRTLAGNTAHAQDAFAVTLTAEYQKNKRPLPWVYG
jgi:hypothetical protein